MAKKANYSEKIIELLNMEKIRERIGKMILYPAIIVGGVCKDGIETLELKCAHCGHVWSKTYAERFSRYNTTVTCPACKKKMADGKKANADGFISSCLEIWNGVNLRTYYHLIYVDAAELNGSEGVVVAQMDVSIDFYIKDTVKSFAVALKPEYYGFISEDYKYFFNKNNGKTAMMLSNAFTAWNAYFAQSEEAEMRAPFLIWMKECGSFENNRWPARFDQYWSEKTANGRKSLGEAHAEQTLSKFEIPEMPEVVFDRHGIVSRELSRDIMTSEYHMEYYCTACRHVFHNTTKYSREEATCPICGLSASHYKFESTRENRIVAVITVLNENTVFIRAGVFSRGLNSRYEENYERNESHRVFLDISSDKVGVHFLVLEGSGTNAVWKEKKNYASDKFQCSIAQVEFVGDVSALKYSGLREYITRCMENNYGGTINLDKIIHYLRNWKQYPVVEQLCKRGFIATLEKEMEHRYEKGEGLTIDLEKGKITDALRLPERLIKHYIKSGDEYARLVKYQNLYRMDPNVREEDLEWMDEHGVDELQVKGVLDESQMSIMRLCEYLEHVRINQCFEPKSAIIDWRDYLKAAKTIEVDLTDNKARYPSSLKREHDRAVAKQKLVLDEKKDEFFQAETERYGRLYAYKTDAYMIIPPKDMKDLFEEGRKLNHCVGSYSDRIIAGETCIMFVRKTEEPDKPYFTIEISQRNSVVIQLRANSNRCINRSTEKELIEFLKEWSRKKQVALNGAA